MLFLLNSSFQNLQFVYFILYLFGGLQFFEGSIAWCSLFSATPSVLRVLRLKIRQIRFRTIEVQTHGCWVKTATSFIFDVPSLSPPQKKRMKVVLHMPFPENPPRYLFFAIDDAAAATSVCSFQLFVSEHSVIRLQPNVKPFFVNITLTQPEH